MAIVGGGVSGVITAKTLDAAGCEVVVFEKAPDLGGVWSATRAYPGIATQDDRRSYAFSDSRMPADAPEHPAGADVRAYLERYVRDHGLEARVRLSTEVLRADLLDADIWEIESAGPEGRSVERFDWLVAANGVFSTPHVPTWPGRAEFEAAGGLVITPGSLQDGSVLDGRRTVVLGWGKTACDVAAVAATRSTRTDIVARTLTWKYPKRIGIGRLTFHHVVLTRAGERVIGTGYRDRRGRVLLRRIPERIPRLLVDRLLARAADRTVGMSALGLRSALEFRASTSLVTEGFFEAVAEGRIHPHRERSIRALGAEDGDPWVELTDGTRLRTDVLVAATGYEQGVDFLSEKVLALVQEADGSLLLHRRVLSVDVPRLAFIGWVHNYRSPLTAEVSAAWLAGVLLGRVRLPAAEVQRRRAARFPVFGTRAHRSHTAALQSVTLRDLDGLLHELGGSLPRWTRFKQIWTPLDPEDYREALRPHPRRAAGHQR